MESLITDFVPFSSSITKTLFLEEIFDNSLSLLSILKFPHYLIS